MVELSIKARFGTHIRRFRADVSSLTHLQSKLLQVFHNYRLPEKLCLKYADDEGEWVTCDTEEEWQEALQTLQAIHQHNQQPEVLHIAICDPLIWEKAPTYVDVRDAVNARLAELSEALKKAFLEDNDANFKSVLADVISTIKFNATSIYNQITSHSQKSDEQNQEEEQQQQQEAEEGNEEENEAPQSQQQNREFTVDIDLFADTPVKVYPGTPKPSASDASTSASASASASSSAAAVPVDSSVQIVSSSPPDNDEAVRILQDVMKPAQNDEVAPEIAEQEGSDFEDEPQSAPEEHLRPADDDWVQIENEPDVPPIQIKAPSPALIPQQQQQQQQQQSAPPAQEQPVQVPVIEDLVADEPLPDVEEPAPLVEEPAPLIEAPVVEEPAHVVEEPVVEEPVVEEPVVEEPAPAPAPVVKDSAPAPAPVAAPVAPSAPVLEPAPAPVEYHSRFVDDLTIPDGASVPPGFEFVKTWRIRNNGTVQWPTGVQLKYLHGNNELRAPLYTPVRSALPGEDVDISVRLFAPREPGNYKCFFRLVAPRDQQFGHKVWVNPVVLAHPQLPPTQRPSSGFQTMYPSMPQYQPIPQYQPMPQQQQQQQQQQSMPQQQRPVPHYQPMPQQQQPIPQQPMPRHKWHDKLGSLHEMGFLNDQLNISLLDKYNGDVPRVIHHLLGA